MLINHKTRASAVLVDLNLGGNLHLAMKVACLRSQGI